MVASSVAMMADRMAECWAAGKAGHSAVQMAVRRVVLWVVELVAYWVDSTVVLSAA